MSDENENVAEDESLIRKEDIIDLSENSAQREKLLQYAAILIGLLVIMMIHNFYSIGKMWTDKSLIMMQCPRQFDLDKPTLLEKVKNPVVIDNWIKSFSISYVMKMFPQKWSKKMQSHLFDILKIIQTVILKEDMLRD